MVRDEAALGELRIPHKSNDKWRLEACTLGPSLALQASIRVAVVVKRAGRLYCSGTFDLEKSHMLSQLFNTDHPVALVTGSGARRVGNSVARLFAAQGCHTVIHANNSREEAKKTATELTVGTRQSVAMTADLTDEDAVGSMFSQIDDRFGRIDILINCAAIWSKKKLEDITADDVRRDFEINTLGTFLCCQHAGLRMTQQSDGGAIVNVGDWSIVRPYADHAAYFPSKGAIPTLTRTFAVELGQRNPKVRVNALLPGPVVMPGDMTPAQRQPTIDATLVKREGGPDCVAQAALSLVSNAFITGACLPVDGGRSIFAPGDPSSSG
jgi:pteridine reductase